MKKFYLFLVLLLCLGLQAQPPGWLYNQPITVSNSNSVAAVNYQLKLNINTQALITAGQMLANGNDLRFGASCTGTVFYNYWIEGGLNTPTTAIWVKIPMIAANTSSTIFMFYGNSGASPMSSIPGTFRGPNSATDSVTGGTSGGLLVCQRGFRFSPNQNILITHFGKNEPTGSTRYVTLFDWVSQAILTQTQVSGPAATYSYGPLASPIWLTSGTQYVLQIYGLSSDGYYYQTSSQIGQHLTYYDMRYSNGGTQNTFPTSVLANYHYGYGDFWYFLTNTLSIAPTYTMGGNLINITATSSSLCTGGSATLSTNASGSFTWNTGSSSSSIVVSPSVTTTYSVAETNSIGCNSNAFLTVTVNAGVPNLSITASAATVCPTNTVILSASGALSYTWSGGISNGQAFSPLSTSGYTVTGQNGCGTSTSAITITVTSLPVVAQASPSVVCSGNTSSLSAIGANNYTWSPGNLTGSNVIVSPQANTVYTVIGTSGVCAGIFTLNLPVNPIPTIQAIGSTSMTCSGESVTLTANGGLNYTWTPGNLNGSSIVVTPTAPTGYQVQGSNNFGCLSTAYFPVIALPGPSLTAQITPSQICIGASATLIVNGADTYSWNTGSNNNSIVVSPVANTTYTVIGTNTVNNCSATKTLELVVIIATISVSQPTAVCIGGSVNLIASGANSYSWNTGAQTNSILVSPFATSTYTVYGQSSLNGMVCESNGTTMVTVNPNPTVTASSTRSNICKGESTILQANGASTYLWNNAATTASIVVSPTINTSYSVTGTNSNNCTGNSSIIVKVTACIGLDELNSGNESVIQVFPNPNKGEFTIKSAQDAEVILVNALGQQIQVVLLHEQNNHEVRVSGLAKGVYFIQTEKRQGENSLKILVNE